ncbi:MAG: sigma 54-interacting transcriptional regulator [Bilophila wadsworthia]
MEPLLMETEYEKPLVLVVDDDPTNLRILVSKLNREYRLGVAKSGTKALEYMGKQIPDLVLLDVMMPDMDGYAVCEHIKRDPRLCDIPVVFISYVDDPSQKTRGFEVGGVDYITKPFHDAEVLARVRTHIMNKQMREQLKRHNAEIGKELDEHRRQLLALLDNLPGLAYRETVIGGIPDARRAVSFVSDGVLGLTGYAPDRFMGEERLGLLDIAHEEDRETIRSAIATALKEHRRWELVYRIITAWGEEKWVWEQSSGAFDASGTLITIEGLVNDITEKQKNELGIRRENEELRERLKARCFNNIVGDSPPMREVFELIARAGATEDCVVVFGESGTGKELAARAVHECSARCDKPFIAVNCGAIPENLFESEFFGYKKGAFTGALADRKGCLDRADGGTLFLDELGELSLSAQTKLLRAIEGQGFTPVGGSDLHKPNFRIIAATNRNLAERVASGQMREDFFYRIHVIPIHLPPCASARRTSSAHRVLPQRLSPRRGSPRPQRRGHAGVHAVRLAGQHPRAAQYAVPLSDARQGPARHIAGRLGTASRRGQTGTGEAEHRQALPQEPLASALDRFEREYLLETLRRNDWKRAETADILGIDRRTLFRKIKQFDLEDEEGK